MKASLSNRPYWHRHVSGPQPFRAIIDTIKRTMRLGENEAIEEFERALFAGELRRVWPEKQDAFVNLFLSPAYYEIAEQP